MSCECMNIKHPARCRNTATKRCLTCGDKLCGGCAKNHHVHSTIEPLPKTN